MRFYAKSCVFQYTWACQFPWAKLVIGDDGLVVAKLKEKPSYWILSLKVFKNLLKKNNNT
jgi:hypothetical protein